MEKRKTFNEIMNDMKKNLDELESLSSELTNSTNDIIEFLEQMKGE